MNNNELLHSICVDEKCFFIQSHFSIDKSCKIIITDVEKSWQSEMTAAVIAQSAEETGTELSEYYKQLKSALCGISTTQNFYYDVHEQADGNLTFEWKKVQKNVKFCMGKFTLTSTDNSKKDLTEILLTCCGNLKSLNSSLEESKLAYDKLKTQHQDLLKNLQSCTHLKENLQTELMAKFVIILNEKKAKIRSLRDQLSGLNSRTYEVSRGVFEDEELASDVSSTVDTSKNPKKLNVESDDDDDAGPILPKRKRLTVKKPVAVSLSPIKNTEIRQVSPVKFPSDVNTTTSSDSTVDVSELLEEA